MATYKKAGVDINKANELVQRIKKIAPKIGGFSGLFPIAKKYKNPVLSASTDGVGTKLRIAQIANKHDTIGIDLVAMCVNDLIACGAKPLFFLDYFATGKLELNAAENVIKGIASGCKEAGCILLGGETAEMPKFYKKGEYDLAGFAVGILEKNDLIDGSKIKPGDLIIGIPSSGAHSNGYSLVNKIFSKNELKKLSSELLKPTIIYVKQLEPLINTSSKKGIIKGIAHITGGGLIDNIPRILPGNCQAIINKNSWKIPEIFNIIQKKGNVKEKEMFFVFNMGIGMVLIVSKENKAGVLKKIKNARLIGEISKGKREVILK